MKTVLSSLVVFLVGFVALNATTEPKIFLKGIEARFEFVDMVQDDEGNTYIAGKTGSGTLIRRFDASGAEADSLVVTSVTGPQAMAIGSDGLLFIAGTVNVQAVELGDQMAISGSVLAVNSLSSWVSSSMVIRDITYVETLTSVGDVDNRLVVVLQRPNVDYVKLVNLKVNPGVSVTYTLKDVEELRQVGFEGGGGAFAHRLTHDDVGYVYLVGQTAGVSYVASGGDDDNRGYVLKYDVLGAAYNSSDQEHSTNHKDYQVISITKVHDWFDVTYNNGWIYVLGGGRFSSDNKRIFVGRMDTTLGFTSDTASSVEHAKRDLSAMDRYTYFSSVQYATLESDSDANKKKFHLSADSAGNVFVTGYLPVGTTEFYGTSEDNTPSTEKQDSVASTAEAAFVLKLDDSLDYSWIKTPMRGNGGYPDLGDIIRVAWDGENSRLWWAGSYSGSYGLGMQEGNDTGSFRQLSQDGVRQGYVAVFEEDGVFTEVVDFTLETEYGEDRVTLNGSTFASNGATSERIINSQITIETPREIYRWTDDGVTVQTDSDEGNANIIDNADTRFSFLNFSVNRVVEASSATTYTFNLVESTRVKLEWLVSYALVIDSDFANTASRSRNADNTSYVPALASPAAGLPDPAVGKHWIEKDTPLSPKIRGFAVDNGAAPGLNVRYVPYSYSATGSFAGQVGVGGSFPQIEEIQQLEEFTMTGPATITYVWKLQYGIDMRATDTSVDSSIVVEYLNDSDGIARTVQRDAQGAGVHWYDDGTRVRIGAPAVVSFDGSAPKSLQGWITGDNFIFSPGEGSFGDTEATWFSDDQLNSGFADFEYTIADEDITFLGREVVLERPARLVWNYGDKIIFKTVAIGQSISFTADEVESFGLLATQQPTLDVPEVDPTSDTSDLPSLEDFIWDTVTKKFFPVRNIEMNLKWSTEDGEPAKVNLTVTLQDPDYLHVAGTPGVSLIPHPPEGEPNELIFQSVAYTTAGATVNDDNEFTAAEPGFTVLQFSRLTTSGRGGPVESVVDIKVVETNSWSDGIGRQRSVVIGQKLTSDLDLAGLGTGYVFFNQAAYNPYIYDATRFIGEALWDSENSPGPVIPVNVLPNVSPDTNDEFVVVWYDDPALNDFMLWPHQAERYQPRWPVNANEGLGRILMSSGFGSESVTHEGIDQFVVGDIEVDGEPVSGATTFDPGRFEQVSIYNQPDSSFAGYNPNEEHALMAPSLRFADVAPRPLAAYAMRESDLNVESASGFTSAPYVLVQFLDKADNEFKMKVYNVKREDLTNYPNGFTSEMVAGEPVIPFYPIGVVSGASLAESTYAREGDAARLVYWRDHKGTAWAVSGQDDQGNPGAFEQFFYYPLLPDFIWPDGSKSVGDQVAWLPDSDTDKTRTEFTEINYDLPDQTPDAQGVDYTTSWPLEVPVMKVGETLTFAGGEYAADNPGQPGLPGVLAWAAGEVVYDALNPDMREGSTDQDGKTFENYTARILPALEQRSVYLPAAMFPEDLLPATGRTEVDGVIWKFPELSSSLKKRVFYDPISGQLGVQGLVNDKDIGEPTLTAAPPAVYILEPNIMTEAEYAELKGSDSDSPYADLSSSAWTDAVDALYELSRNPNGLSEDRRDDGAGYTAGLQVRQPKDGSDPDADEAEPYRALGPGLALVANPGFLDPNDETLPEFSYVTLAENNDESLGGSPVTLHIIKIDRAERYRGAIKVVLSDNVFDENIILRHTGDFGANADDLVFDWWYRVEDGTAALPPDQIEPGTTNPWKLFPDPDGDGGEDFYQLKLKGNPQAPELLLADSLWFVRYRHKDEAPENPITWERTPEIPFQWAGAGNSSPFDLDGNGIPDYQAQLAQGWVKRVLDAVNPYEARIRDFNGDAPATYASMIRQFGQRYEGPVALNPAKNVIENVGLIELYSTVLNRARNLSIDLSTPVSTPGITNALQLASTRLADFYMLLGNEAYSDAQDPMIGHGSNSADYGDLVTTVFTFQNQLSSKMEEELGLLRGVWDYKARPVYNRLFWNFTKGEGEAAYATNYNISDVNTDGFIDEDDAMILYPQGHGDAWGHYLTAIRAQYELIGHPYFNWVSRSELYSLQDIVFDVDFLDERKFAQVAAAKAKAGAEVVQMTYRERYVEDPEAQWQGYLDSDTDRAWGVEGWARRAGQGAYFDWVTANALIPSEHPNSSYTGIRKVDRTTVKDIAVVSANMNSVQRTFEDANDGFNPLGIAGNTVTFDIDPSQVAGGNSHFEQVYDRAVDAIKNAYFIFDQANKAENLIRKIENNEVDFRRSVFEQDMAYRNQLIEIFGSPYAGTIGSGKAFPAGYQGPDTVLYMYVDRQSQEISATTVPGTGTSFVGALSGADGASLVSNVSGGLRATYSSSFSGSNPADWFGNFGQVDYILTEGDGITFFEGPYEDGDDAPRVDLVNFELPIKASGYTFVAPDGYDYDEDGDRITGGEDWGDRASPGLLQRHISKMVQKEAEIAKAIAAWDGMQGELVRQMLLVNARVERDDEVRKLLEGKIIAKGVTGGLVIAQDLASKLLNDVGDTLQGIFEAAPEFIPKNLPTGGLAVSPGDAAAPARGAMELAGAITSGGLSASAVVLGVTSSLTELGGDIAADLIDLEIDAYDREYDLKEALVALENLSGDEGILRVEVYRQQEALRELSDEYRAILMRGARLIDEREAYNKRVAELAQRNRYQDMSFRVTRNTALQRYHESFDLAARYVYLAAKAYDYETNLHPDDAGSAQGILGDIVGERSIGQVVSGTPFSGRGGLAEQLVRLKSNYDVLKGQLGLNNPQTETGRFSLRQELYRISPASESDENWQDVLEMARVDNLWDMPEFRRYCRPFAAYDPATPEPGIVIDFSSFIESRKNFFGKALAGGDNTYDPTNFATKIYSVGTWFEGYLSDDFEPSASELSETPRIYLVPVGSDVMAYPSDNELGVRLWNVLDQKIPVPYPVLETNLDDNAWRPLDSLGGTEGENRKFSSYRAYHDSGYFDENEMTFDTRLVGRSVWNTRWLLIIPGATLNADSDAGLDTFIQNVSDIKLFFQTYGYSGN